MKSIIENGTILRGRKTVDKEENIVCDTYYMVLQIETEENIEKDIYQYALVYINNYDEDFFSYLSYLKGVDNTKMEIEFIYDSVEKLNKHLKLIDFELLEIIDSNRIDLYIDGKSITS